MKERKAQAKGKAAAGPSTALRFAQDDEFCGFWEEMKSKSDDSRRFVVSTLAARTKARARLGRPAECEFAGFVRGGIA
jgi:hypothetical protein